MFAVPGWSVSSSNLKTQTLSPPDTTERGIPSKNRDDPAAEKPTRKHSRNSRKPKALDVNPANLANLWETVIEGKPPGESASKGTQENSTSSSHGKKRRKAHKSSTTGEKQGAPESSVHDVEVAAEEAEPAPKKRKKAKEKRGEKADHWEKDASQKPSNAPPPNNPTTLPPPKPTTQLTPLQLSMRQKLISARFRHLNQALYTTPSARSMELFQENPEMFQEYHEGFRRQVEVWPENPVDGYIQQIRSRGALRGASSRSKSTAPPPPDPAGIAPLPRTSGTAHIADLGCGDARLAHGLQKDIHRLHLHIHSFDLQSPNALVTRADIAALPLADGSIDVAIFCLALMGTNWIDFIEEAFRVLRWKGELWVAEIKSRFARAAPPPRVAHSVGKRVRNAEQAEQDEQDLEAVVDGQEDGRRETDVAAFVEVLRKRGFVLQGEADGRNKMFVRMRFVKALTPVKGKGVPLPKGMVDAGETWQRKTKGRFIDEDTPVSSEASVLKPCVYKLR
jgi:ribosomal RNA-processing protein 8